MGSQTSILRFLPIVLNEEELALIHDMRPGLIQLEIGVQSTNEITIREIHRTMKLELLKDIVRKIQGGENIHEHLDLIAGLPYEDYATFAKSFDEIYALKPNQLQLGVEGLLHVRACGRIRDCLPCENTV